MSREERLLEDLRRANEEIGRLRYQRDELVKAHDAALKKLAEMERGTR